MPCLLRLQAVFNADDEHLTAAGWDKRLVDALRIRRETVFQHVTGSVEAGRLNCCVLLSYAAPSFCTVPLTLLIAVYVTSFYEVCDPYLTVFFRDSDDNRTPQRIGGNLALLALFQALARSFDVVTDPAIAYATDTMRC